jgi:hypothetical protein
MLPIPEQNCMPDTKFQVTIGFKFVWNP